MNYIATLRFFPILSHIFLGVLSYVICTILHLHRNSPTVSSERAALTAISTDVMEISDIHPIDPMTRSTSSRRHLFPDGEFAIER